MSSSFNATVKSMNSDSRFGRFQNSQNPSKEITKNTSTKQAANKISEQLTKAIQKQFDRVRIEHEKLKSK